MEKQFVDDNFAITIPDGWHVVTNLPPTPGMVAAYGDVTRKRMALLLIGNERPSGPMSERLAAEIDQGFQRKGRDIRISGKFIDVGGIKSYERLGSLDSHGKHITTANLFVPGENRYYDVQALRTDGDVSEDPEIQQIIGSFRFLHPFVPSYGQDSVAYRAGEIAGASIVIIFVVGVVVYAVRSHQTPRLPPSHPRPPPIPPGGR